jgi:hypothetical protein
MFSPEDAIQSGLIIRTRNRRAAPKGANEISKARFCIPMKL